jgi:glycine C-acetyltransferase
MEEPSNQRSFQLPETRWPVKWAKEQQVYFYLEPVEELRGGRVLVEGRGEMIMLSSYSYLGLLSHPEIEAAAKEAIDRFSTGTHGVRLLAGTLTLHNELERKIAAFKGAEAAIVYSSGYVTNLTTISTLVGRGDLVVCDKLNHASIVDGCLLSGAKFVRFRHNDMEHLERRLAKADPQVNKLVVADAVFSMDGDVINLPEVSRLCRKYGAWLMIDEAHSLGVLGQTGHGIEEHFGLSPETVDIKMGTLSKTIPSVGGYIAANADVIDLLKHQSRAFIFSAALPPAQVGAALAAFDIIECEPERVARVQHNMVALRDGLQERGFDTMLTETPVVPLVCGEDAKSWAMAKLCQDAGLFVQGIPSPVVPQGTARLRCIVTAAHTVEDIQYCLDVFERAGREVGVI